VSAPQIASRWTELLAAAFEIIDYVNKDYALLTDWTFGGGTAMMIQIDHRESHDIDLFLDDVQLLPYVEAAVAEMQFSLGEPIYNGDGTGHIKVAFDGIGEIDFIVTAHMTEQPSSTHELMGRDVELETIPEIIAKKVRFRGSYIQPRDVFDIAAACEAGYRTEITAALAEIPDHVATTLDTLGKQSRDYVDTTNAQLMLRRQSETLVDQAFDITLAVLAAAVKQ
jgi:hypothetical protein